jgi:hypothetical protein
LNKKQRIIEEIVIDLSIAVMLAVLVLMAWIYAGI